jgi:transposase
MITLGIDAHKRTHTVVAVDEVGRTLGEKTTEATTSEDHLGLVRWADRFGAERSWAVEDCHRLSRRLEADLIRAGERIARVPPKLMAHARDAASLRRRLPNAPRRCQAVPAGLHRRGCLT